MKRPRLFFGIITYLAIGFCGLAFNMGHAKATPISNSNLTNLDDAQRYVKKNRSGYLTYTKNNVITGITTILYHPNAGSAWNIATLPSGVLSKNNDGTTDEKDACVDLIDSSYTFRTNIWANRGNGCGSNGTTTTSYRGGKVNINPPDDFPVFLFVEDVDGLKDRQHIVFTSSAIQYLYTPNSDPAYSVSGGNDLISNGKHVTCSGEANCNAIVLLMASSFNIKAGSKDGSSVMRVRNNTSLPYRTLTFNPNAADASVADIATSDAGFLWSHPSGSSALREYEESSTASTFPTPNRSGYTFQGWYTSPSGNCKVLLNCVSSRSMNSDVTLYAHWASAGPPPDATCSAISLAGMTLTRPGTYTAAMQLSNAVTLPTFQYRIYKQGGAVPAWTTVTAPALQVSGTSPNQKLSTDVVFTPATPGTYELDWQVTGSVTEYCPASTTVGYQPYFTVLGGDILGGFDAASSVIASWNSNDSVDNYRGAGTTLAAIAGNGGIQSFVTSSASNSPTQLAFANIPASAAPTYGGHFTATPSEPDYYGDATGTDRGCVLPATLNNLQSGLYTCSVSITLNGGVIPAGINATIRTTGNVFIAGNITYASHDLTNIPRLNVIALGGNVVISSGVNEMHGVFVSQRSSAGGGLFYSCGDAATAAPYDYTTNNPQCMNSPLSVYGSVVADELILSRTKGSWTDATPAPAETFVYSPETWLSKPAASGTSQIKFDSYISLPPVL